MTVSIIIPHLEDGTDYLEECLGSIDVRAFSDAGDMQTMAETRIPVEAQMMAETQIPAEAQTMVEAQIPVEAQLLVERDDPASPLGVAAMRNRALMRAEGEYVLFLDSDDYLSPGALQQSVCAAEQHPGCIIAMRREKTAYRYATTISMANERVAEKAADRIAEQTSGNDAGQTSGNDAGQMSGNDAYDIFNDSCLGLLIPAALVRGLRFDESLHYYSDLPFMAELISHAETVRIEDAVYYQRVHNDSVAHPALSQRADEGRFTEYHRSMYLAAGILKKVDNHTTAPARDADGQTLGEGRSTAGHALGCTECAYSPVSGPVNGMHSLARLLCDYLVSRCLVGKYPKALAWRDADMQRMCELCRDIGCHAFDRYDGRELKLLKAFAKGRVPKVRRMIRQHHDRVELLDLKKSKHQRRLLLYNKLFTHLPVDRRMVAFSSFFGRSYCDSPRAIYEYMLLNYPEYKYVWFVNTDVDIPGKVKRVRTDSLKYYYYQARAGAYVLNVRQPEWYVKRSGAVLLETWHGTPLKRLVFDLADVFAARSHQYKKRFHNQAMQWDGLISDNAFSTQAFESAFRYPKEQMLETGYPRNDLLYAPDAAERAEALKKKLGLPLDRQIVLYAPTWRDDEVDGTDYGFRLQLDMELMRRLKDRYFFILRTHYLISEHLDASQADPEYVRDLSSYNDIAELYLISDILITDYSSVFFDYANLNRPILFYVYDLDRYRDILHGFYFDMAAGCPGPMLKTSEEVLEALEHPETVQAEYAAKYAQFREKFCYLDDGHAAERATKELLKMIKGA